MNKVIKMIFLIVLIGCNSPAAPEKENTYYSQIALLETDKQKNDFLCNLWQEDQKLREGGELEIRAKFGADSKEYKQYIDDLKKRDNQVFLKMKSYLEIYGYPPNKSAYHELAINAFPIIIGHNHDFNAQKELLPYLYNAYKKNHCALDDVVWVLGEMYESKNNGRRYRMKSDRYTTEQEFNELVEALDLEL